MAEGNSSNLSHSQINVGDEYIDLCCTKCHKNKLTRQAKKYCMTCKEYFCDSCVETHNSFKELSGHPLVDPNAQKPSSSKQSGRKLHAVPTEQCKHHPLQAVNMYCGDDDSVGCPVCITLHHRTCDDIHYIPEYLESYSPDQLVDQINNDLTQAIQDIKQLETHHNSLDDELDQSKATCKQEIQNYRGEINYIIDKIEAATLVELDARYKDLKRKSDDKNQGRQDLHNEMVRYKSEIESDQTNDSQKFVLAKLSRSMIMQGQEMQSELPLPKDEAEPTFTKNIDIIAFILSFCTLGLVGPVKRGLYTALDELEHNMQEADDSETCGIRSSCFLDNRNLLLADESNCKLKLVENETYTISSSLKLNGALSSVCRVNRQEAAVSLDDTIQFISINDNKLVPAHSYHMDHKCRCVAVIGDMMFVGDTKDVHVYTLNGRLMKTISEDRSGNAIFSFIYGMAVGEDAKIVYVTDWDKGVICLNTDGQVVWSYTGGDLRSACGVCTDGDRNIMVCGEWSDNVVQLGPQRHYMGEVVTEGVLKFPQSVSFDKINRKLVVGSTDNNNIQVFTVQ